MAANYDRLFQPPDGADFPDEPSAQADYDVNVPTPSDAAGASSAPSGRPPMPIDLPQQIPEVQPEPPAVAPGPRVQAPARHARQKRSEASDPTLGDGTKKQHSHRAGPRRTNGNGVAGPSVTPATNGRHQPSGELFTPTFASAAEPASRSHRDVAQDPSRLKRTGPDHTRTSSRDDLAISVPDLEPAPARPAAKPVPRRGWRRWLHASTGINAGLSRDEKYELELQARIRRTIRGSYEIGVLGLKGGAGKTSVTAALGSVFARARHDRILVVDADPVSGNLSYRVGRQSTATIADMVANQAMSHYNDVRAHTSMNAVKLEVLAAPAYTGARPRLSEDEWQRAMAAVPRYYNLVLADCGADLFGPATRGALLAASGVAIVSNACIDSIRQAAMTLDWLRTNGYTDLLDHACVVINKVGPGDLDKAVDNLIQRIRQKMRPGRVVVLPFDKHIAAGTEIQFDLLSDGYKRRISELAAALSDDFDRGESR